MSTNVELASWLVCGWSPDVSGSGRVDDARDNVSNDDQDLGNCGKVKIFQTPLGILHMHMSRLPKILNN